MSHHSPEELRDNPLVWLDVAAVSWLIIPGLILAILSSAIGSIPLPRTLKRLLMMAYCLSGWKNRKWRTHVFVRWCRTSCRIAW